MLGTVLILAALSLFIWNHYEVRRAGAFSETALPRIIRQIEDTAKEEQPDAFDPYDDSMTEAEIDGYTYIGYVSIPALDLSLPVMSEWNYDLLKLAPCRYAGSAKTHDLVLAAHNYSCHFGLIKDLSAGDEVLFTDMEGATTVYEVTAIDILAPSDIEEMTAGDYALTLFTCDYSGQSRVTVRCEQADDMAGNR